MASFSLRVVLFELHVCGIASKVVMLIREWAPVFVTGPDLQCS